MLHVWSSSSIHTKVLTLTLTMNWLLLESDQPYSSSGHCLHDHPVYVKITGATLSQWLQWTMANFSKFLVAKMSPNTKSLQRRQVLTFHVVLILFLPHLHYFPYSSSLFFLSAFPSHLLICDQGGRWVREMVSVEETGMWSNHWW